MFGDEAEHFSSDQTIYIDTVDDTLDLTWLSNPIVTLLDRFDCDIPEVQTLDLHNTIMNDYSSIHTFIKRARNIMVTVPTILGPDHIQFPRGFMGLLKCTNFLGKAAISSLCQPVTYQEAEIQVIEKLTQEIDVILKKRGQ